MIIVGGRTAEMRAVALSATLLTSREEDIKVLNRDNVVDVNVDKTRLSVCPLYPPIYCASTETFEADPFQAKPRFLKEGWKQKGKRSFK